jgi:hypothetical protein
MPAKPAAENKPDRAEGSDLADPSTPAASLNDTPAAEADDQGPAISVAPLSGPGSPEPEVDEPEVRDGERDPGDIIDFVIRKRSRNPGGP